VFHLSSTSCGSSSSILKNEDSEERNQRINHRKAYKYLGVSEKYNMEHKYEKEILKENVKRLRSLLNTDVSAKNKM